MKYQRKDSIVSAVEVRSQSTSPINGIIPKIGDYIVTYYNGKIEIVPGNIFLKEYSQVAGSSAREAQELCLKIIDLGAMVDDDNAEVLLDEAIGYARTLIKML